MESLKYNYEFVSGFRKNSKLLLLTDEKQVFRQKHMYREYTRYGCYINNCSVTVALRKDGVCEQLSLDYHHNHSLPEDLINKFKMINNVKKECGVKSAYKRKGVREIFDEECMKDKDLSSTVSFPKMRRQLYRIRSNGMPKNPSTSLEIKQMFEEVEFFQEFGISKHINKPFYRDTIIEDDFSYSILISPTIADIIQKKPKGRRYLIDGTFKTVPSCGFKQLLVVHFYYMEHTFPFIYVLMSSKTRQIYEHLFQFINSNFFQFEALAFHTDYEVALRKALQYVFPTAALKGCWFHYCQALTRKCQKIKKFRNLIKTNNDSKNWYRKILSLPLVSPEQIEEMFLSLKNEILDFPKNRQECFNIFMKYFENQWMAKITPCGFSVHLEPIRTTSALEGFNSKLSRNIEKHGQFHKFFDAIRNEDFHQSVSLSKIVTGALSVLPKKRKKQTDKDSKIRHLTQQLHRGEISLCDFFNFVTNKENHIVECDELLEENVEEETESDDNVESQVNFSQMTEVLKCIICLAEPRNILLMPCKHFKICSSCFQHLDKKSKENSSPLLCPYCRQIVESNLNIFQ